MLMAVFVNINISVMKQHDLCLMKYITIGEKKKINWGKDLVGLCFHITVLH